MKIINIEEDKLKFNNGYELQAYHEQSCYENVYADFEILKNYNVSTITGDYIDIKEIEFAENLEDLIWGKKGIGFNLVSKIGEKFFVPCYNEQNGYYSSNLILIFDKQNGFEERLDISDLVKDIID